MPVYESTSHKLEQVMFQNTPGNEAFLRKSWRQPLFYVILPAVFESTCR